ncbi:MAG TPA: DUF3416 domain-containing protein, partial [Marmoricola sp.]|nr:DUF3416 domain-containing protein [Marmoricola sp.]
MVGRIPIMDITPVLEHGRYAAKATVSEPFEVTAVVFREGHDKYVAEVLFTDPNGRTRAPVRMTDAHTTVSRLRATITPDQCGPWQYSVQSWSDPIQTWLHAAGLKVRAGVDVELMLREGALLLGRVDLTEASDTEREVVNDAISALEDIDRPPRARLAAAESEQLAVILAAHPIRELVTQ